MRDKGPAVTPIEKLPIGPTLAEVYNTLFRNFWPFVKIAAFPLLLFLILPLINFLLYPLLLLIAGQLPVVYLVAPMQRGNFDLFIEWGLQLIPLMVFSSHWMQFLIASTQDAGARDGGGQTPFFWSRRDLRLIRLSPLLMIDWTIVWSMLALLHYARLQGFDDLLTLDGDTMIETMQNWEMFYIVVGLAIFLLATVVQLAVLGRSAPAFAAAAHDKPLRCRSAWGQTKSQTLRLATLWALIFWLPVQVITRLQGQIDVHYLDPETLDYIYTPPLRLSLDQIINWRLLQLPSSVVMFVCMALGAVFFLRVFGWSTNQQASLLERFD